MAKKKAAKKKAGKKKATKQKQFGKYTVKGRYKNVLEFVKAANKALGGDGKIVTGDQVDDLEFRRELTGNPAFDYVTNGGLIIGGASSVWGRKKSLKTTSCAKMVAEFQRRGLACALASVENFDKPWWRRLGVYIPYGGKEFDALSREARKKAKKYNAYYEKAGWIPLTLFVNANSLRVLDSVIAASRANVFSLIVVDSLGAVVDLEEVEGKSLTDTKFAGNSVALSKFATFVQSTFNYRFDENNVYAPTGNYDNQTIVLCINQARVTIGTRARAEHKKYHPPGGEALGHLWNQEVFFYDADNDGHYEALDSRKVRTVTMRTFRLINTKLRGGPEERPAEIDLITQVRTTDNGVWQAGDLDVFKSLRAISTMLGVVEKRGANLYFADEKYIGKIALERAMRADRDLYDFMYADMIAAAKKAALTDAVPEVPS